MPGEKKYKTNLPEDNQTSTPFRAVYLYVMSCSQIRLNLTEMWFKIYNHAFIVLYKTVLNADWSIEDSSCATIHNIESTSGLLQ